MSTEANKSARMLVDMQPTVVLELFDIIIPGDVPKILRIHGGVRIDADSGSPILRSIIWRGKQYYPMAIESSGFEVTSNQRLPRPKIRVSNIYYSVSMILNDYNNLKDSKVIRTKVFLKFIDNENFAPAPGETIGQNPFGTPDPNAIISRDEYIVSQKTAENKNFVEFELNSPLDLENADTLKRIIVGRYCSWKYRGMGCRYNGVPICKIDGGPFSATSVKYDQFSNTEANLRWVKGEDYSEGAIAYTEDIKEKIGETENGEPDYRRVYYVAKNNIVNSSISPGNDPKNWEQDACSKTIDGCKKRFYYPPPNASPQSSDIIDGPLPFGGFPGTDNFYYHG